MLTSDRPSPPQRLVFISVMGFLFWTLRFYVDLFVLLFRLLAYFWFIFPLASLFFMYACRSETFSELF